jgi:plastocyanin
MYSRPIALLATILLAACGGSSGSTSGSSATPTSPSTPSTPSTPSAPTATTSVSMVGSAFSPPDIQVSPGATVTFTNQDNIQHNVTFSSSSVPSTGNFSSGAKTVVMPTAAGTYDYHCSLHAGMQGTVKVQ